LQSRSPKKGPPFPSPIYYSSSFQRSSPLSKFEKTFETIRKNNKECKKTLKKYNFRKLTLLHIVPFCEGPNKKSEGFVKEKQKT
jgi:hypothetical protein